MPESSSRSTSRRRSRRKEEAPPPTWDEKAIKALKPYTQEIFGGLLFMGAFLLLFRLIVRTSGEMGGIAGILWQLAGWGSYFIILSIAGVGVYLMMRQMNLPFRLKMNQIVGFEMMIFAALPLTYIWSNSTQADALAGDAGGTIGWALGQPSLEFLGPILTNLLFLTLFVTGTSLLLQVSWKEVLALLEQVQIRLMRWANQIDVPDPAEPTSGPTVQQPSPERVRPVHVPQPRSDSLVIINDAAPDVAPTPRTRRSRLLPPMKLLVNEAPVAMSPDEIDHKKRVIEQTLADFGLAGTVTEISRGPAITQFGVTPGYLEKPGPEGSIRQQKVRVGQIATLNKDLALALAVPRLRIEAPVPGRGIVGIEVPNSDTSTVRLRPVISSTPFKKMKSALAVCLGLDVSGAPQVTDLGKLPHLLIAGTTGSGKSVFVNALVSCLLFNNTPDKLQLIMIDPKKVELIRFNGLPHLMGPVETEHDRAVGVLRWVTEEMDRRYQAFAEVGAKSLAGYNRLIVKYKDTKKLPHLVVFIDELADLMATYPADVERDLCRLAQMARATGIHLVVATQRPSTDVITGLIKANFPARCSFAVASSTDSRVVLDTTGAESLLGKGDMLFLSPDAAAPKRIQGVFMDDSEIEAIVQHWEMMVEKKGYEVAEKPPWERLISRQSVIDSTDELIERAIAIVQKSDSVSTSLLQRKLRVGFPRAARIMETLFEMGLVEDPKTGGKTRKTHVSEADEDPLDDFIDTQDE